jgi:hypothetical protein
MWQANACSRFGRVADIGLHRTANALLEQQPPDGVVTLSQIERNSPITANAEAWDFSHLACCSIPEIELIALNVTTPSELPRPTQFPSSSTAIAIVMRSTRIVDYVVIHGPKFWKRVEMACPDFQEPKEWLRVHGRTLDG